MSCTVFIVVCNKVLLLRSDVINHIHLARRTVTYKRFRKTKLMDYYKTPILLIIEVEKWKQKYNMPYFCENLSMDVFPLTITTKDQISLLCGTIFILVSKKKKKKKRLLFANQLIKETSISLNSNTALKCKIPSGGLISVFKLRFVLEEECS